MNLAFGICLLVLLPIAFWPIKRHWDAEEREAEQRHLENLRRCGERRRRF